MTRPSFLTIAVAAIAFLLPWQTRWIYGAVFIDGAHTEYGIMSLFVIEALIALVTIGALLFRSRIDPRYHPTILIGAGLVGMILLGTVFVDRPAFSLAMATHLIVTFALFVLLLFDRVSLRVVCAAFALGLVAPLIIGALQILTGVSPSSTLFGLAARDAAQLGDSVFTVDGERMLRAYGSFSHPNIFGGFLAVALFAWWHMLASVRSAWPRNVYRALGIIGSVTLLGGILATGSRSAMLGLFLGLIVMLVARFVPSESRRSRLVRIISIAAAAVIVIASSLVASFTAPDIAAELRGGGVHEERSLRERVVLYQDFVPFAAAMHPVVGYGVGAYVLSYADSDPGKPAYSYQPIHNAFLLFFAETGLLGTLLLLWFLIALLWGHRSPSPSFPALPPLGMASVIITIAFYDHYLWSSWAGLALTAFVFAMLLRIHETPHSTPLS